MSGYSSGAGKIPGLTEREASGLRILLHFLFQIQNCVSLFVLLMSSQRQEASLESGGEWSCLVSVGD